MAGLLDDVLGYMQDPRRTQQMQGLGGSIRSGLLNIQEKDKKFKDLQSKAFADPKNPANVTDKAALAQLTDMVMSGPMGFAQAGMLAPKRFRGKPLQGMPEAVEVGGRMEPFGTDQRIVDVAGRYMADQGITYKPQEIYAPLDVERATRLANAFEKMKHTPTDKKTQKSYKALAKETQDQYEALLKAGYKFDFIRGADPYGNPRNAINDIIGNKRMSVFPTEQGFGGPSAAAVDISGNPLMARSDLRIGNDPNTTYNDLFRAVHDVFGHAKHGVGFRARGEENAFQSHARMYSPEALPAATSETRGQNSWVNFGPFAQKNRIASPTETEYAAQKTGLLPRFAYEEGLLSDWLWPQGVYRGR